MSGRTIANRGGALVLLVTLASACGDDPTGVPDQGISRADAAFLAVQVSGLGAGMVDEEAAQFDISSSGAELLADVTRGPGLLRARACPEGGELELDLDLSLSFADGVREMSFSADKSMTDCAFARNDDLFTVNGDVRISGSRKWVDRALSGPQVTEVDGSLAVTIGSTGETNSCVIDISSVYDPATRTREVTGSFCGHDVSERAGSDG